MSSEWFYQVMGETRGPISSDELRKMAYRGQIDRDTLVKKGAGGRWVSADSVHGLFEEPPKYDPVAGRTQAPASQPASQSPIAPLGPQFPEKHDSAPAREVGSSPGANLKRFFELFLISVIGLVLMVAGMWLTLVLSESVFHLIVIGTGFLMLVLCIAQILFRDHVRENPPLASSGWFLLFYGLIWCNYFLVYFDVTLSSSSNIVNTNLLQHRLFGVFWSFGLMLFGGILQAIHYAGPHLARSLRERE